jgi:hypothetical protein
MLLFLSIIHGLAGFFNQRHAMLTIFIFSAGANSAGGCPGFLTTDELNFSAPSQVSDWRLFRFDPTTAGRSWRELPLQIDSRNEFLEFTWFLKKDSALGAEVSRFDRISFETRDFGPRLQQKQPWPCRDANVYELKDNATQNYAYLMHCKTWPSSFSAPRPEPVKHNITTHTIQSRLYAYEYWHKNHLVFDQIVLNPLSEKFKFPIASASNQSIRADIRNFFTLNFDKKDVESRLLDIKSGPVGLIGRLTFYLRLLFLKIDLQLNTAVSFFENSVYVPMVINFPVDAHKHVHPGSGIFFSWISDAGSMRWDDSGLPKIASEKVLAGSKDLAEFGLPYCKGSVCNFKLAGEMNDQKWQLSFQIHRTLVSYGFFPMFVSNANEALTALKWQKEAKVEGDRVAFYFETSGLPKGEHPYDFWIQVADIGQPLNEKCPKNLSLRPL